MAEIFQYLVHASKNPCELESFKPLPTYLSGRAPKSETNKVVVPSDLSSPSHQIALALHVDVGEVGNPPVDLPPSPPTPLTQNLRADLDCDFDDCHEMLSPHPLSCGPSYPLDFCVLCSSASYLSCDVHKDQVMDRVGVEQSTHAINFYEYLWES